MIKRGLATFLALVMSMSFSSVFATGGNDASGSVAKDINEDAIEEVLPTVTVTEIDVDRLREDNIANIVFGLNFKMNEATDKQLEKYGGYYADFVLRLSEDITFNAEAQNPDGFFSGQYNKWSNYWISGPAGNITLKANEEIRIVETISGFMENRNLRYTYAEIYENINSFDCGLYLSSQYLSGHPDLMVSLEFRIYNGDDDSEGILIGGGNYTYTDLPEISQEELDVKTIKADSDIDFTYALNFKAGTPTDEQIIAYGDWYTELVLTLNKDATLSENNESSNGYLAGIYKTYSENWLKIPQQDDRLDVKADKGIRIIKTAADGIKQYGRGITYREFLEGAREYSCGVYFTTDFLRNNPDLEATFEFRIYHPESDEIMCTVGNPYTFKKDIETSGEGVIVQGGIDPSGENKIKIEDVTIYQDNITDQTVTIDTNEFVKGLETEYVDTVTIPADAITAVDALGENATLNIKLAGGEGEGVEVSINKKALAAILGDMGDEYEGSLTLKVKELGEETYDGHIGTHTEYVNTLNNKVVYKIMLETENGPIYNTVSDDSERKIEIKITYTKLSEAGDIVVEHLKDDGTRDNVTDFKYESGKIILDFSHFSEYVIYQKELSTSQEPIVPEGPMTPEDPSAPGNSPEPDDSTTPDDSEAPDDSTTPDDSEAPDDSTDSEDSTDDGPPSGTVPPQSTGGSGGGSPYKYTVTFETDGGNKIDSQKVSKASKAKEPEKPIKEGYSFVGWYADKDLTIEYSFDSKVTKDITIYAKWIAIAEETPIETPITPSEYHNRFFDVKENEWFYEDVKYAYENGLMSGVDENTFAPESKITRAMFVAILYRADGSPAVNKSIPFADVKSGEYYENAVIWAQQNGIVSGVTETDFAPDAFITREQVAAIMLRFAQYRKYDIKEGENTNILSYEDVESVSAYAVSAMQYALGSGLLKGKTQTTVNPLDNTTRAEVAAVVRRFIEGNTH